MRAMANVAIQRSTWVVHFAIPVHARPRSNDRSRFGFRTTALGVGGVLVAMRGASDYPTFTRVYPRVAGDGRAATASVETGRIVPVAFRQNRSQPVRGNGK